MKMLLVDAEVASQAQKWAEHVLPLLPGMTDTERRLCNLVSQGLLPQPEGEAIEVDDEYCAPKPGTENAFLRSLRDEQRRTISAIEAERDVLRAEVGLLANDRDVAHSYLETMRAERDALRDEVERLAKREAEARADFETLLRRTDERIAERDIALAEVERLRAALLGRDEAVVEAVARHEKATAWAAFGQKRIAKQTLRAAAHALGIEEDV